MLKTAFNDSNSGDSCYCVLDQQKKQSKLTKSLSA